MYWRGRQNFLVLLLVQQLVAGMGYSSWLFIGNIALSSPFGRHMCDQMHLAPQQKVLCQTDPNLMGSVRDGARLSIEECQNQFRNNRWNCSTASKGPGPFGKTVQKEKPHLILTVYRSGSREAAFVHAITSAGVTYAVTQACSRGELDDCSCDRRKRGSSGNDSYIWGGCSDDVRYGMEFAKSFIDASETDQHDARARMNKHNNRVGRRAVRKSMVRKCKCHGPTATCQIRTCWDQLEDFKKTGDYLKSQFLRAMRVSLLQDGSLVKKSRSPKKRSRPPSKKRLVYLESSPNYCRRNLKTGSLGTSGRECNRTSKREDGCDHVCCGRGYDTKRVTKVEQCNCKFHWCCKVICQTCSREVDVHTCKPEVKTIGGSRVISGNTGLVSKHRRRKGPKNNKNKFRGRDKKVRKRRPRNPASGTRRKREVDEKEDLYRSPLFPRFSFLDSFFDALKILFNEDKNVKKQTTYVRPVKRTSLDQIWSFFIGKT